MAKQQFKDMDVLYDTRWKATVSDFRDVVVPWCGHKEDAASQPGDVSGDLTEMTFY